MFSSFQSLEDANHEKAVDLLKGAQGEYIMVAKRMGVILMLAIQYLSVRNYSHSITLVSIVFLSTSF